MQQVTSPAVIRNLQTLFISTVHRGDLTTNAQRLAINTAMADPNIQTVVFDRPINITTRNVATGTGIFQLPGKRIEGRPNAPLDFSMAPNSGAAKYLFRADGTAGEARSVTANVAAGDATIIVGSTNMGLLGLSRGDKVTITSDRLFVAGGTVGTEECGEIVTVTSTASDRFTCMPPVSDSYLMTDAAKVQKISMIRGLTIEGVRGIGPGQFATDVIGDRMFHLIYCDHLRMDAVESQFFDNGNYIYSSTDAIIRDFRAEFQTQNARTANQYGLAAVNACQDFVVDSAYIINGKHGVAQSESNIARGVTRRFEIRNSTITGTWNFGIATHTNAEHLLFSGNQLLGCNGGIEAGTKNVSTRNNVIRFLPEASLGIGIGVTENPENFTSEGDRVFGGLFGVRMNTTSFAIKSGSAGPNEFRVSNFYAERFQQSGVQVLSALAGPFFNVTLTGINTRQAGGSVAPGTPASITVSGPFTRVQISNCNLQARDGNTAACILTSGITDGRVQDVNYHNHAAPILGGTDVTSDNVTAF
jgi:hypothetical protein